MDNPFSHFTTFVWSVGNHIVTLLSGCVVTVLIGIIEKRVLKRPVSIKLEIGILCVFLFFACFQAWRDQYQKTTELEANAKNVPTFQINVPPAQVILTPTVQRSAGKQHTEIQNTLSKFLKAENQLREDWRTAMSQADKTVQTAFADRAQKKHSNIDSYLQTIPRGAIYSARFNGYPRNVCAGYPLGHTDETCRQLETLEADINALQEFIRDPDLGQP